MPNNVNFFIWFRKSHSPRLIIVGSCLGCRCTACLVCHCTLCLGHRCTSCLDCTCTSCLGRRCTSCLGCRCTSCLSSTTLHVWVANAPRVLVAVVHRVWVTAASRLWLPLHHVFGSPLHLIFNSISSDISVSPCAPSACNSGIFLSSDSSVLMVSAVKALHRASLPGIPAIFLETMEGNMHSSNESTRDWSLREANV